MKKTVSLFLVLALLCTLLSGLSLNANAADAEGKLDNMTWRIDNNVLTLSGSGAMPKADNKTQWRAYYETVTRVIIEPGITSISDQAFYNFFRMSEISIPETVRTIGEDVFWACPQLTRIDIPEGVESIGGGCFSQSTGLKEFNLPSTLKSIGFACFAGCTALTEMELPASVTTLGESAFSNCTALQSVRFGSGLTKLPGDTFARCEKLTEVVLPDTLTEIEYGAFKECKALERLELPEGLEVIGRWAFERAEKLVNVELPDSVRLIDYDAFRYVSNLRITIKNPDCVINYDPTTAMFPLGYSPTVVGYEGSTAQEFAKKRNYPFVLLNGCAEGHHNFTKIEVVTPPTCQAEGERRLTCEFCSESKTERIPTVDHNDVLTQVLQAPTYFEEGRGVYTCTMCGRTTEGTLKKLDPGYFYQQVLYDRDDWSGAYLLGGFTYEYSYDGSARINGVQVLAPKLNNTSRTFMERFNIYGVQADSVEFTFVFDKLSDGSYTIRSYWTGQYLTRDGAVLGREDAFSQNAKWNVYVDSDGYFVIASSSAPAYQLLYNDVDNCFQLLDTFTYEDTTYQAEDVFGIWLFEPDPCVRFQDVNPTAWYHEGIDFAVANNLFNGVSSTRFGVDSTMTRAMFVTVLWRLEGEPEAAEGKQFRDVPEGTWYTDAVAWAAAEGIVNGTSETTFSPDAGITREQMAVLMYRYANWLGLSVGEPGSLSGFPDAAQVSGYAVEALGWATANGIVTGTTAGSSVILKPQGGATRAQVATILMRFLLIYLFG